MVEDRLQEWDKLPPDVQKELLGMEPTLRYFTEIEGLSDVQRPQILDSISPARRKLLEKGIQQWDSMSEDQRQQDLQPVQPVLRTDRGGEGESAQDALRARAAAD